MSKLEKLLQRIKNHPKTVRFEELDKILTNAGYERAQPRRGSSHYTYRKSDRVPITIPRQIPFVHEVYVHNVIRELNL
ncbi:MAG: type II toxin-antitoxin system HicA family toxin [Selenomonadaceae bacterium]|nr:type II toxin-antitoxin system HicA family toxin [Selenomonadaceae bacterium]